MRKHFLVVAPYAIFLTVLAACSPVGVVTSPGAAVLEDRTAAQQAQDAEIRLTANKRLLEDDSKIFRAVGTQAWEGRVLLTGAVTRTDHKLRAVRTVRAISGVKDVIDEIQVTSEGGLAAFAGDVAIEEKLKLRLLADGDVRSVNYSIRAVNGTVYLLGEARSATEHDKVKAHAQAIDGVRRVVSYVRVGTAK